MSSEGIVISIIAAVLSAAWLALPLVRQGRAARQAERAKLRERANLVAAYERALVSVRDLDEDFAVGKLSQEQYEVERVHWTEQGATILAALEANGKPSAKAAKAQQRAAKPAVQPVSVEDDPVEQAIAAYARARKSAQG